MDAHQPPPEIASRALKISVFTCAVLALGLLLWARFLLVTGHPRTAIAQPPGTAAQRAAHAQ